MIKKLISFGYRHGKPNGEELDEGTPFLCLDVRLWIKKNPFHNRKLRQLRGTDKAVQEDILKTPGFELSYAKLRTRLLEPDLEGAVVYIGCTGGHHRSVFVVERLSHNLGVPLEHRDFYKK